MTVSEQIDNYLLALLATIRQGDTVTNSITGAVYTYQTDIGQSVSKNLEYREIPDEIPACVLFTGKNSTIWEESEFETENHIQEFSIEAYIADDRSGAAGDAAKQDISVALKSDHQFGGLIEAIQNLDTDSDVQNGEMVFSLARVSGAVRYVVSFGSE